MSLQCCGRRWVIYAMLCHARPSGQMDTLSIEHRLDFLRPLVKNSQPRSSPSPDSSSISFFWAPCLSTFFYDACIVVRALAAVVHFSSIGFLEVWSGSSLAYFTMGVFSVTFTVLQARLHIYRGDEWKRDKHNLFNDGLRCFFFCFVCDVAQVE